MYSTIKRYLQQKKTLSVAYIWNKTMAFIVILTLGLPVIANQILAAEKEDDIPSFHNPFTASYIRDNLSQSKPRLIYNQEIIEDVREKIQTDPVVANIYKAIRNEAFEILEMPVIERIKETNAMLSVSRGFVRRINMLGTVYLIEKDETILERINQEVISVSNFVDWNPPVYLDAGEISMAMALALDWTADALPESTIQMAKKALIEKGIHPSWPEHGGNPRHGWWITHPNNWNQVCNGGMIAASIVIAEDDPELAAKTISRSLEGLKYVFYENYYPEGVYPESPMYWEYGTSYSVLTINMLKTAFGSDFGMSDYPGFMQSAVYKIMTTNTPSGWYYNYADCKDEPTVDGDVILAWFAAQTGKSMFWDKEKFLTPAEDIRMGHLTGSAEEIRIGYLTGAALAWMSQYNEGSAEKPPKAWVGRSNTPIAVFRGNTRDDYYFAAKGGCGIVSHGHLDAGSFIFELNGVRWSIEMGIISYMIGEQGFDLWRQCQECERWELMNMHNQGHSTLTINGERHLVDGYSLVSDFHLGDQPSVTFDLTPSLETYLNSARRTFAKKDDYSLAIEDQIEVNELTELITWQFITRAKVEIVSDGAILRQDGQILKLNNDSHPEIGFKVVSLDPPPHRLDKRIENLKRIELQIPANSHHVVDNRLNIRVELKGI